MSVFGEYARYYDLLYADKDYAGECDFLEACFRRFGAGTRTVLDLACGTGGHGLLLGRRGYEVTGVDRSAEMLAAYQAKAEAEGLSVELHAQPMQELDLERRFDAAVCMFDALGYVTDNAGLAEVLRRTREHVRPGGLFVFDCWHAAGVFAEPDPVRVREMEIPDGRLLRISRTSLNAARQVAAVEFHLLAFSGDRVAREVREVHEVRYFLPQEVCYLLESTGWHVLHLCSAYELDSAVTAETRRLALVATPAPTS